MAKIGISIKLDVTKIDKARLFSGQKGTYLDATAFIDLDELDQYGNSGFISQDVSKEEREQGVKGNILGNTKVFYKDGGQQAQANYAPQQPQRPAPPQQQAPANPAPEVHPAPLDDFDDDIPFNDYLGKTLWNIV